MQGVLAVSGVIGTWAGPRSAGTAYVMAHHHIGDIGDGQIGAWGFPRGGMGGVSEALASAARSFGRRDPHGMPRGADRGPRRTCHRRRARVRRGDRRGHRHHDRSPADLLPPPRRSARPARRLRRDIERWRSRSGTVKINLAVDRLPEFASKPGFDPEVHGGTIVLAEQPRRDRDVLPGRRLRQARRRVPSPTSASRRCSTTRSRREGHHIVSMFTQWVPHTWNTEPHTAELDAYADRMVARMDEVAPGFADSVAAPAGDRSATRWSTSTAWSAATSSTASSPPGRCSTPARPPATPTCAPPSRVCTRPAPAPTAAAASLASRGATSSARCLADRTDGRAAWRRRGSGPTPVTGLQAALPRHHYVEPEAFGGERERVLLAQLDLPRAASTSWAGAGGTGVLLPGRLAVVDLQGESVLVTDHARRRAARARQRVPSPGFPGRPVRPGAPRRRAVRGGLRCAARTTPGPTTSTVGSSRPRTPTMSRTSTRRPSRCTRWASTPGAGSCGCTAPRRTPRRCSTSSGPSRPGARATRWSRLVVGRRMTYYDVAANWKVLAENYNECYHCGPVHPELSDWSPRSAAAAAGPGLGRRHPAPRGRLDVHPLGHERPHAVPRPRRERAGAPQGRAGLPEPAAVAVGRPRRRLRRCGRTGGGHAPIVCDLLFAPDEVAKPDFDPSDAAELWDLTNRQDWAICESVQRGMSSRSYTGAGTRPMEDAEPRHPSMAAAPPG